VNSQSPDVGDIAVLQDAGDVMITPNPLDLRDVGLRLTPNKKRGTTRARSPSHSGSPSDRRSR
jgi:hypothetical protein